MSMEEPWPELFLLELIFNVEFFPLVKGMGKICLQKFSFFLPGVGLLGTAAIVGAGWFLGKNFPLGNTLNSVYNNTTALAVTSTALVVSGAVYILAAATGYAPSPSLKGAVLALPNLARNKSVKYFDAKETKSMATQGKSRDEIKQELTRLYIGAGNIVSRLDSNSELSGSDVAAFKRLTEQMPHIKAKLEKELNLTAAEVHSIVGHLESKIDAVNNNRFNLQLNEPKFNAKLLGSTELTDRECAELAVPKDVLAHAAVIRHNTLGVMDKMSKFGWGSIVTLGSTALTWIVASSVTESESLIPVVAPAIACAASVWAVYRQYKNDRVIADQIIAENRKLGREKLGNIYGGISSVMDALPGEKEMLRRRLPIINEAIAATGLEDSPEEFVNLLGVKKDEPGFFRRWSSLTLAKPAPVQTKKPESVSARQSSMPAVNVRAATTAPTVVPPTEKAGTAASTVVPPTKKAGAGFTMDNIDPYAMMREDGLDGRNSGSEPEQASFIFCA